MLFNTFEFLALFLPAVLIAYSAAKQYGPTTAQLTLLLASLGFYTWWNWRFTPLLLGSLAFNYLFGRLLAKSPRAWLLWIGIAVNLLPLALFKYLPFAPLLLGQQGFSGLVIPLGISFYTFLQIAYLTAIYRGQNDNDGFIPYAVFVTYFPHLIAGPILKLGEFAPQMRAIDRRPLQLDHRFAHGLQLLVVGLFKKVIIADTWCAPIANAVFDHPGKLTSVEAWTGAIAYTCQLFADFSGYCEMALGMSLMLGITIPINFASPYRSRSIAEFWRRWHISLGTWFREHVYIPLGGSRHGMPRAAAALFFTMVLCGVWHGAGWTFFLWGVMHGAYLVIHRLWALTGRQLAQPIALLLTLACVIAGWVVFRAHSVEAALSILKAMAFTDGITLPQGFGTLTAWLPGIVKIAPSTLIWGVEPLLLGLLLWFFAAAPNVHEVRVQPGLRYLAGLVALATPALFAMNNGSIFLYANF